MRAQKDTADARARVRNPCSRSLSLPRLRERERGSNRATEREGEKDRGVAEGSARPRVHRSSEVHAGVVPSPTQPGDSRVCYLPHVALRCEGRKSARSPGHQDRRNLSPRLGQLRDCQRTIRTAGARPELLLLLLLLPLLLLPPLLLLSPSSLLPSSLVLRPVVRSSANRTESNPVDDRNLHSIGGSFERVPDRV